MAGGTLTWFAYSLASVVVLCCAYSYVKLNEITDVRGGSVSFIEDLAGQSTVAGVVGWTLVVGYIGTMAMYAYAFGAYGQMLVGVEYVWGLPFRPFLSVGVVAVFVGLNLLGAGASGAAERYLVFVQAGIIAVFGLAGLGFGFAHHQLRLGLSEFGLNPIVAASVGFVSFEGWQLLFYDQESIEDPVETIRKAVYISIPVAVVIYALVGVVTVNLAPEALQSHPHVALKDAARTMVSPYGLGAVGAILLSASALFSTGSAINATLFSAAHFSKGMLTDDLLPDDLGDADGDGVPERTVLVLGAVTAAFSAVGSLGAITSFASLSFIVVFGAMSYLAFRQRDRDDVRALPPAVGAVGAAGFFPLMLYNLYDREPNTFYMVLVVAAVVVVVELLYFERDRLEREVERFGDATVGASVTED
jgi:amino acid transporter